jgi:MtN3 and saliva related transmembrane protein
MSMTPDIVTAIGYAAGALTTISFLPQLIKTWRCRSAREISWGLLLVFAAGVTLWLLYGLELRSAPIIVANVATLILVLLILGLKAYYQLKCKD